MSILDQHIANNYSLLSNLSVFLNWSTPNQKSTVLSGGKKRDATTQMQSPVQKDCWKLQVKSVQVPYYFTTKDEGLLSQFGNRRSHLTHYTDILAVFAKCYFYASNVGILFVPDTCVYYFSFRLLYFSLSNVSP